jgi:hypothetical protein
MPFCVLAEVIASVDCTTEASLAIATTVYREADFLRFTDDALSVWNDFFIHTI